MGGEGPEAEGNESRRANKLEIRTSTAPLSRLTFLEHAGSQFEPRRLVIVGAVGLQNSAQRQQLAAATAAPQLPRQKRPTGGLCGAPAVPPTDRPAGPPLLLLLLLRGATAGLC